jgi:hypothetical protein
MGIDRFWNFVPPAPVAKAPGYTRRSPVNGAGRRTMSLQRSVNVGNRFQRHRHSHRSTPSLVRGCLQNPGRKRNGSHEVAPAWLLHALRQRAQEMSVKPFQGLQTVLHAMPLYKGAGVCYNLPAIEYGTRSYPERWRDWPDEARQPGGGTRGAQAMVPIPTLIGMAGEDERRSPVDNCDFSHFRGEVFFL